MPATLTDIHRKYGDSVYPLYKDEMHAPYMEDQNSKGGYLGIVLLDEKEDKIKCEECGKWFTSLGQHVNKNKRAHPLTPNEYKQKHGLLLSTPLVSIGLSNKLSKAGAKGLWLREVDYGKLIEGAQKWRAQNMDKLKAHAAALSGHRSSYQSKNKVGLCEAQMAARYLVVMHQVGWNPGIKTLKKHDSSLAVALLAKYGSMTKARKALKLPTEMDYNNQLSMQPNHNNPRLDDAKMIADLRTFIGQYKRLPTRTEYKN